MAIDDEIDSREKKLPSVRLKGQAYADESAKVQISKPAAGQALLSKPIAKKRIMEVVLPRAKRRRLTSSTSTSSIQENRDTEDSDRDETTSRPAGRHSRAARKRAIIDDDGADGTDETSTTKDSDYDQNCADTDFEDPSDSYDESDGSESSATSATSESEKSVRKLNPTPKMKSFGKAPSKSSRETDISISESETKAKGNGAKQKSTEIKPIKRREDTDPWKLDSKAVKSDWTQMSCPPLEIFQFARLVVDEYTYLVGQELYMISGLSATRRWVLSGTPPIADLSAVKTISAFLNIQLGSSDEADCVVKSSNDDKNRVKSEPTSELLSPRDWPYY